MINIYTQQPRKSSTRRDIPWHRKFDINIDEFFNSVGSKRGRIRSVLVKTVPLAFAVSTVGSQYAEYNFQVDCSISDRGDVFLYNAFTSEVVKPDGDIQFKQHGKTLDNQGLPNAAVAGDCFYYIDGQYYISDAYPVEMTGTQEQITEDWSHTFDHH